VKLAFNRKSLVVVGAVAIFAAVAGLMAPRAQLVDMAKIERGRLRVTVDSDGRTRIRNVFVVPAMITGYMERIPFKPGDRIRKGDAITTVHPAEPDLLPSRNRATQIARVKNAEAQLEQASADVERLRAALEFAKADLTRKKSLRSSGATAIRTAELAELEVKSKTAELRAAKKNVRARQAQIEMERAALIAPVNDIRARPADDRVVRVTSPISGVILKVTQESEDMIKTGAPLVKIGNPRDLEIILEMLSTDAVKVRVGAPADIDGWGGVTLKARVRKVEPEGFTKVSALGVEEQRVVIVLDFTDPREKWGTMSHGYRVDAKILVWEAPDVLKVPVGALFRIKNQWMVYVAENGTATLRKVVIEHKNSVEAEVKGGLKEGETVILHPNDQIVEGAKVETRASQ
jgi:HlyD family secretion protein